MTVVSKMHGTELKVGSGERSLDKLRSRDTFDPIKCSVDMVGKRIIGHRVHSSVNLGRVSLAMIVIYVFDWLALIFTYTKALGTYFFNYTFFL